MSRIPRTDVELLRCAPLVDIAMFLEAKDNMIAQDFGEYCINININKYIDRYQYIYFFVIEIYSSDWLIQAYLVEIICECLVAWIL